MSKAKKIPVVLTTDRTKRGVFFGYISADDLKNGKENISIIAEEVQMCVYWAQSVRGVLGLAATGPSKDSRVTKPVKSGRIEGVTLVLEASHEAVAAWKSCPWG